MSTQIRILIDLDTGHADWEYVDSEAPAWNPAGLPPRCDLETSEDLPPVGLFEDAP